MKELINKLVPKYLLTYFGTEGLTSSEANHIANMAKEVAENHTSVVNNMSSSNDKVTIEGKEYVVKETERPQQENFDMPGKLFGLSTWLRQAVKARETVLDMLEIANLNDIDADCPVEPKDRPNQRDYNFPIRPDNVDITQPLGEILDIKEYAEYLALEAKAAHLGKFIHAGGPVDRVREELLNWKDFSLMNHMDKSYVVAKTKVYTKDEINELYFKLQAQHRDAESKLNWYKAKIKNDAVVINANRAKEYAKAYNEAQIVFSTASEEFAHRFQQFQSDYAIWSNNQLQARSEVRKLFSTYKIIIPDSLVPTVEYLNTIIHSLKTTT